MGNPLKNTPMDPTKARCAAVTMVRGDYFFLRRWIDYYGAQIGREHLYILSHGDDPEIRKLAEGANYIHIPYDPGREKFDAKRWQMLSFFVTGLTRYYNWVLCNDVDEFVVADPDEADGLLDYLDRYTDETAPKVICPFAIEIVHNPDLEKAEMTEETRILSARRLFRLNANYSKPCLTRSGISYSPGGHSCNINDRGVEPHLYLVHLRFFSYELSLERLRSRQEMRKVQSGGAETGQRAKTAWDTDAEGFLELCKREPVEETIDFPEFRRKMMEERKSMGEGRHWFFGGGRSKVLYRLPERFTTLF